jgi:hypothetical protein
MKLIPRRKKSKAPVQKVLDVVRLAVRGLVAVRIARSAAKGYKVARKLPLIGVVLGIIALVVKRARDSGTGEPDITPPPSPASPAAEAGPEAEAGPAAEAGPEAKPETPAG